MFLQFFFFILALIPLTTSISNQEDLAISNYSHIGCLTLYPNRQYLSNRIQTNSLLAYQTFSSSNMTIDLCFRLCRRWIILINHNHTTCICLYTMNKPYQLKEYLGEISYENNCTSNALQIYSLTNDYYVLPIVSTTNVWSLDGCYYLQGIQAYRPNLYLHAVSYTQAIDSCQRFCQQIRNTNYLSFFLSLKRACYCLPFASSATTVHIAVRKPLVHCSFLSYIKNAFSNFVDGTQINPETVVKIDVQRYCSSTFTFEKNLYLCLKLALLNTQNTYSKISRDEMCSPILISTSKQWNSLRSFSFIANTHTFVWIDRNSSYIINDLFQMQNILPTSGDLCIVVSRTSLNQVPSFNLLPCTTARFPSYVLCAQKTLETTPRNEEDFKLINTEEQFPVADNVSCPSEFVLFNNLCYYVDPSFVVYDTSSGERVCSNKYSSSTLVRLDSHAWGNINATRFLGRTFDDVLLEFFYYQLETKTIQIELNNGTDTKQWIRLLFEGTDSSDECILRYFIRSSGTFTILSRCDEGGHPACQCEPIRNNISKIISIDETTINSLPISITTESTITTMVLLTTATTTTTNVTGQTTAIAIRNKTAQTTAMITTEITLPAFIKSSNVSTMANESRKNNSHFIPDEDLDNNKIQTNDTFENNTSIRRQYQRTDNQYSLMILTISLLAFVILAVGVGLFVRYIRRSRGSYSTRSNHTRRPKRSSTNGTSGNKSNTPAVLYTKLKSPPSSARIDVDMSNPFHDSPIIDDNVQLLPQRQNEIKTHKNLITNDEEEESFYAIPRHLNEK